MSQYNKANPCQVTIKDRYPLTKKGSTKETFHVSLDLQGVNLPYKVGDAIGVFPQNASTEIENILSLLKTQPNETISHPKTNKPYSIKEFLLTQASLQKIRSSLLKQVKIPFFEHLLQKENKTELSNLLGQWDLVDWLKQVPGVLTAHQLTSHLMPLLPRFYSVASSPIVYPDEIHLLVACFSYFRGGEEKRGIGSDFLCYTADVQQTPVSIYVQPTAHFTLPTDSSKNLIMIGPGTGVAPYKAFLEERIHHGSTGKHWLFFGERNQKYDFFYEKFFNECMQTGHLSLELAFSRDQKNKLYVQHKMLKHAEEIFRWIQEGAIVYVCGDAKHMAKDVNSTILQILAKEGNLSEEQAKQKLRELRKEKRYLMDVY